MIEPTEVRTLDELGQLTAEVLRGESEVELIGGFIEDETAPIASTLAIYNENGYVTTNSQPADSSTSRAFVTGYCNREVAARIQSATIGTDLVAVLHAPGQQDDAYILTGVESSPDEYPVRVGWASSEEEGATFGELLTPQAGQAVAASWTVEVFDPKWGRNDLIWITLKVALEGEK